MQKVRAKHEADEKERLARLAKAKVDRIAQLTRMWADKQAEKKRRAELDIKRELQLKKVPVVTVDEPEVYAEPPPVPDVKKPVKSLEELDRLRDENIRLRERLRNERLVERLKNTKPRGSWVPIVF